MKKFFLAALCLWLFLPACKKDEPQPNNHGLPDYTVLPPATQEGKNTFGCLVNGEVWVPRVPVGSVTIYDKGFSFDETKGLGYGYGNCTLLEMPIDDWMSIGFGKSYFQPTEFNTTNDTSYAKAFSILFRRGNIYYRPDEGQTLTSNRFTLTRIDTVRNFISGTFEFTLYSDNPLQAPIEVTDGRFDLLCYTQ